MAGTAKEPMLVIELDDGVKLQWGYKEFGLTPVAARHLARKLNRLALRIEKRAEASAIEAQRAATPESDAVHESAAPEGGDAQ